jgi:GNAT superfamily N-acetyltransferase
MTEWRQRAPFGGLWDAADFEWWWRDGGYEDPDHQLFFESQEGTALGFVLLSERYDTFDYEIHPDFEHTDAAESIFCRGLIWLKKRVKAHGNNPSATAFFIKDGHTSLRRIAEDEGFRVSGKHYIQAACPLPTRQRQVTVPDVYHVRPIREGDLRSGQPPVLSTSKEKFSRVRETPMYRREHHLVVADRNDKAVAEAICWVDESRGVGVFEPVETLEGYRGLGLARALLTEGMQRMIVSGVKLATVSHYNDNLAAAALYESVGFRKRFERVVYVTRDADALRPIRPCVT